MWKEKDNHINNSQMKKALSCVISKIFTCFMLPWYLLSTSMEYFLLPMVVKHFLKRACVLIVGVRPRERVVGWGWGGVRHDWWRGEAEERVGGSHGEKMGMGYKHFLSLRTC